MRALAVVCLLSLVARAHEPNEEHPDETAPVLIDRVEAVYPPSAMKAGIGGTVSLEITVGADGNVKDVKVVRSAGFGLDEAALEAARKMKFRAATHDGQPIASTVLFDQKFVLRPHLSAETTALPEEAPPPAPQYSSTVTARGPISAASSSTIRNLDFDLRPKSSPNDILNVVPGLVTAQHQGGGKADQLFLRGFDADHGTDVGIFLDGIPINLPSHAHGQGYSDLHFLIPEAVDRIEVLKGPYDARYGDFSTAGTVNIVTREKFNESSVALTVGGFPTEGCSTGISQCKVVAQERFVGIAAPSFGGWAEKLHPWVALEIARDQGPFISAENLERYNLFAKISYDLGPKTAIGLFVEAYGSGWHGSGQIPSREVDAHRLDRFDAIDPSEGGITERQMFTAFLHHRDPNNELDATVYVTRYRLSLWNDFTFFLNDPVNGDEIEQDDARTVSGANLTYHRHTRWRSFSFRTTLGAQVRYDGVHVDEWNAQQRTRLSRHGDASSFHFGNDDDIDQLNLSAFLEEDAVWTRWLRTIVGLRADYFDFDVNDQTNIAASGTRQKSLLSPKASVVLSPHRMLDLYLNFGMGFHSNDARIAIGEGRTTPSGSVVNVVPRIYAGEVGARVSWRQYLSVAAAFWASYLENETVFNADDATFEPSDPTRRLGVDLEIRAQPLSWLYLDFDLAYADAELVSGGALALAPRLYQTAGATVMWRGLRVGLRERYLGERPAFNETSPEYQLYNRTDPARVNTQPWVVVDLYGAYRWRWLEVAAAIQNLFNSDWREAQVGNQSCTRDETYNSSNPNYAQCGITQPIRTGVTDVHFTPGAPFNLQLTLRAFF